MDDKDDIFDRVLEQRWRCLSERLLASYVPDNVKEAMKVAGRARNVDGKWMHPAKAPGDWRPSSGCNEEEQW